MPIVRREHFNRYYSSGAYYLALTLVDIPTTILGNFIFISITYFMTHQPLEILRISLLLLVSTLIAFTSQGLGLLTGSMFDSVGYTLIVGAFVIFLFVMFSGFFILMKDSAYGWHWLFHASFMKHGLDGAFLSLLGFNREKLTCDATYCHFRWPHKFLESLGIQENFLQSCLVIVFSMLLFRVAAFFIIRHRLKH